MSLWLALALALPAGALPRAASILDYDPAEAFPAASAAGAPWRGYAVVQTTFPSKVRTVFPANNTVWTRLLLPAGAGPHPCVVALPMLFGTDLRVESRFWEPLLERGIAVLLVELPFQFHRRPGDAPTGRVFLARSPEALRANFAQAVLDVRRALTWLGRRPDIDPARLGLLGISLGALVGATAYAVDPRLRDAALLLAGADLRGLLERSALTGPTLRELRLPEARLALLSEDIEPLLYRNANAGRPALLVNAWWDRVIPAAYGRRLKEALPAARQVWVPGGHYSAVIHLAWMPSFVARHFERTFRK